LRKREQQIWEFEGWVVERNGEKSIDPDDWV